MLEAALEEVDLMIALILILAERLALDSVRDLVSTGACFHLE